MNFYKPKVLPRLMGAPNGARPKKKDHSEVPVTISEIVSTAKTCFDAGAGAIHFHIRDKKEKHVLDPVLCREALVELQKVVRKMHLQITTEAVGRYSPDQMRKLAYDVMPPGISIGLKEMIPTNKPSSFNKLKVSFIYFNRYSGLIAQKNVYSNIISILP